MLGLFMLSGADVEGWPGSPSHTDLKFQSRGQRDDSDNDLIEALNDRHHAFSFEVHGTTEVVMKGFRDCFRAGD
jgi:hypothetical protein